MRVFFFPEVDTFLICLVNIFFSIKYKNRFRDKHINIVVLAQRVLSLNNSAINVISGWLNDYQDRKCNHKIEFHSSLLHLLHTDAFRKRHEPICFPSSLGRLAMAR